MIVIKNPKITVRFTKHEFENLKGEADRSGLPISTWAKLRIQAGMLNEKAEESLQVQAAIGRENMRRITVILYLQAGHDLDTAKSLAAQNIESFFGDGSPADADADADET